MSIRMEDDLGQPTETPLESVSPPWENVWSSESWDLSSSRDYPLGKDSPFWKWSADESKNDKITLGLFLCVCELLEVIYVGINEIIWPN